MKEEKCVNCKGEATLKCCWKNIDSFEKKLKEQKVEHEIPYDWHPMCDKCAGSLYSQLQPGLNLGIGFWINEPIV